MTRHWLEEDKCFQCGKEGYYTAECTKAHSTAPSSSTSMDLISKLDRPKERPDLKDVKCYNCHQRGHLAKKCPIAFYCEVQERSFQ